MNIILFQVQGGMIEVTRVQGATPPIFGTFELSYKNRGLKYPLPADASVEAVRGNKHPPR